MSFRDPEVLEVLRDQPELLAIADAVEDTQRLSPPSRQRALTRAGAVVALGAVALVAVLLWPSGDQRTSILDRASAAIGDGRVMHVVLQTPSGYQFVEVDGGRTITPTNEVESWTDGSSTRSHSITREQGRVIDESLNPEDDHGVGVPDPAFTAFWDGYRNALDDGTAKLIGDGAIYGHRVYWLQFPLPGQGGPGSRVAVDQGSYLPVAIYAYAGRGAFIHERVVLARTEQFSASDFRRRLPRVSPRQRATGEFPVVPQHSFHLAAPWLTAGPSIQGVSLRGVSQVVFTSGTRKASGVELSYGSDRVRSGAQWIRIDQAEKPTTSDWRGVPEGFVKIMPAGEEQAFNGSAREIWSGNLVANGVYVTIETDLGRDGLLAVARALKPA